MSIKTSFRFVPLTIAFISLSSGCRRSETFPDIGTTLPSPTDVVADKTGSYFYVLNADYPRDYNVGSIVTITSAGDKIGSVTVPRLGRSLTRAGDDLLATFSSRGDEGGQSVQLFDLSNPKSPNLVKEFAIDGRCNPISAVMREGYKYFAVACAGGQLLVGELKSPRSDSTLVLVRSYPGPRRAMHINTNRNLLFAFPTNLSEQTWADKMMEDHQTWDESHGNKPTITATENAPNEVPDDMESSFYLRNSKGRRGMYQFAVYDLDAAAKNPVEKGGPFPYLEGDDVQPELRWVYFNLLNFDGSPDIPIVSGDNGNITQRYYRTNFWQAQPDAQNDDVFYLSHRGYSTSAHPGSPHANSIVKVQLIGNILDRKLKTDAVLSFQRVYGFKGELDPAGRYYPCSFQIQQVKGEPLLLVNHFRDQINFPNDQYFSLAAKVLGDNTWFTERATTDVGHSYYQVALTPSGRGMAISFFGNVAILLDAFPGTDINELKTIN